MLKNSLSSREIKILTCLISCENYLTGKEISQIVGCSIRTIQKEIVELSRFVKNYNCQIESKKGYGYLIVYSNYNDYCDLKDLVNGNRDKCVPTLEQNRVQWLIKKLSLLYIKEDKPCIKLDDLCDELYISMSTLKNDLKTVRSILNNYDLELSRFGNSGIGIKGEEYKYRCFISQYIFNEKDETIKSDFLGLMSKKEGQILKNAMLNIIKLYDLKITDLGFDNLFYYMIVTITRAKNKNFITETKLNVFPAESIEYLAAKNLCDTISKQFKIDFYDDEINFITEFLKAENSFIVERKCVLDQEDKNNLILIKKVLNEIKIKIGLDLSHDTTLVYGLVTHLKSFFHRFKMGIKLKNELLEEIKHSYFLVFELSEIMALFIEKDRHVEMDESEVGFLTLHFGAALERLNLNKPKEVINAIVICASGVGTSVLIKTKIEAKFSEHLNIVGIYPAYALDNVDLNNIDLIISTVDLSVYDKPIIKISPLMMDEDLNKLEYFIFRGKNDFNIKISDFFHSDLFEKDKEFIDRFSAVEYMSNKMVEKGYIDKSVKKFFIERENLGTTEIGNLVAFPHIVVQNLESPILFPCILKKPMKWAFGEVQLILMLALDNKTFINHKNLFLDIYEKINEYYKVNDIINKNNLDYIKEIYD